MECKERGEKRQTVSSAAFFHKDTRGEERNAGTKRSRPFKSKTHHHHRSTATPCFVFIINIQITVLLKLSCLLTVNLLAIP
mmetsp:Transcript_28453/g.47292  ORF Transcript_28453/g.47292 Transcript_28453/m.47292 type:complete len:81 (-) Transcript_28453:14-256(-)